jgi:hypothetical protein
MLSFSDTDVDASTRHAPPTRGFFTSACGRIRDLIDAKLGKKTERAGRQPEHQEPSDTEFGERIPASLADAAGEERAGATRMRRTTDSDLAVPGGEDRLQLSAGSAVTTLPAEGRESVYTLYGYALKAAPTPPQTTQPAGQPASAPVSSVDGSDKILRLRFRIPAVTAPSTSERDPAKSNPARGDDDR